MQRSLTTAVLAVTLAASCHNHRQDPDLIQQAHKHREWMDRLSSCSPQVQAEAIGLETLRRDALDKVVVVRGFLELGSGAMCTPMDCEAGCCNRCSGVWVVVPLGGSRRELAVRRLGEHHLMPWNAMDCQQTALREMTPKEDMIVTGTLQGEEPLERLVDATLCVVK